MLVLYAFFFFQAEDGIRDLTVTGVQTCAFLKEGDGIRDLTVTGVQTCALPICPDRARARPPAAREDPRAPDAGQAQGDLRRYAAGARQPAHRPHPHDVDRKSVV